ncbi:hypothetical protein [Oceanobacillus kimchii]|uniref:Uncharacterized protein n=1 Tax=Oceanobacillus kimchii TaxID=746691 RepID=A0ABQ5TJ11_9BACI|nr:hypothetical protein [Oceanobacillus kimchii]GLO66137.1 hypothetical protein MACH08_19210 [Oceanobacillus kimchii]
MKNYSDYFNTNLKDKLVHDGTAIFQRSLLESPDSYIAIRGDEEINVLMQSTSNYNERRILSKHDDVSWGDVLMMDGESWLVTERPYFNKIHDKTKIRLCNNEMKFTKIIPGELIGYDDLDSPIYSDEREEEVFINCVVESISDLNTKTSTGQQINVPDGDMVLQIQNTDNELIVYNSTFEMYGTTYRISGIDRSKVLKNKGVLILVVSRTANT